jgi:UDP-glucuronate decarboxylase
VKEGHDAHLETLGPRGCFIDGKRFAENITAYYGAQHKFQTKILRIFNTYGPKMRLDDGRIIPDFVHSALQNQDIAIAGDENTTSTFCYAADMIDGFIKVMGTDEKGPFNIGSEQLFRLKDVAEAVIQITGSRAKVVYTAPPPSEIPEPVPDIAIIKEKIGWLPITPLESGLTKTIKAMQGSLIMKWRPEPDTP